MRPKSNDVELVSSYIYNQGSLMYVLFFCIFLLTTLNGYSQISLAEALFNPLTLTTPLPFDAKQTGESARFDRSYCFAIENSNHKIPDRLYEDFALTQFHHAIDFQDQPCRLFRKFSIPNNPNFLAVVSFGGVTDWRTDVLCVISPNRQLLDTLEVSVSFGFTSAKQFRINAQGQIITTTLKPTATNPIFFESYTSFMGQRMDRTYTVNNQGKLTETAMQLFQPRLYTRALLDKLELNLWENGETPLN